MTLYFHPLSAQPIHVRIGETTAQDLNIDLGPPLRIHYKEDDRMTIHSTSNTSDHRTDTDCSLFLRSMQTRFTNELIDFYNYFQHGIEFLISGSTHVVRKILIHTNVVSMISSISPCTLHLIRFSLDLPYSRGTNDVLGKLKASQKMTKMVNIIHIISSFPIESTAIDSPPRMRFYDRVCRGLLP